MTSCISNSSLFGLLTFLLSLSFMKDAKSQTPESIVQKNLDCYNNRDLDCFMSLLSKEIEVFNFSDSKPRASGFEAVRNIYQELFKNSPDLHSTIQKRILIGNKVIDHEHIVGRGGSLEILELVLIYEVKQSKIYRITVIRN